MLCRSCDKIRFERFLNAKSAASAASNPAENPTNRTRKTKGKSQKDNDRSGGTATVDTHCSEVVDMVNTVSPYAAVTDDTAVTRVNELLTYVIFHRDRSTPAAIIRVITSFFTASEIAAAKKCLLDTYTSIFSETAFNVDRRDSTQRPAHEAEAEDIMGMLESLDIKGQLELVTFAAADLNRVPNYSPEESNMCSLAARQSQLEATMEKLSATVQESLTAVSSLPVGGLCNFDDHTLTQLTQKINSGTNDAFESLQNKLDNLSSLVASSLSSKPAPSNSASIHRPTGSQVESKFHSRSREQNIVLYGIAENRDRTVWYNQVSSTLRFVVGREVEIADAFRLGGFKQNVNKNRPVLVSLRSVWDKRLILDNSRKLISGDDVMKKIFIVADEPVEMRRKKALHRMRDRAVRDGKHVDVSEDGCLSIDGVPVYSVKDGKINHVVNDG